MRNIILIVSILVVPFVTLVGLSAAGFIPDAPRLYGRISIALVFAFTGLGHFVQTDGMMAMLPPRVPFGGHGRGPSYLVPRGALQLLLIGWTLYFTR